MRVLVAGASGFVGSRLCPELEAAGHEVRAMTRHPDSYQGSGTPVQGDVGDEKSLAAAMPGCQAAYYLVHSLDSPDFAESDARAAWSFGMAAAGAGVQRIVYLGGLGKEGDELSEHLQSRREVEGLLGAGGVPVTTLRAGIIVGHGGISWEMTRQLVDHLPAMIAPRWVTTRTQPIAVDDVIHYLLGVLDHPDAIGQTFEIGGPEVLTYLEMMQRVAALKGKRRIIKTVPVLTPRLSSYWLALVTDVDGPTSRALVDSMTNEVVVTESTIRDVVPFDPTPFDDAARAALAERREATSQ